MSNIKYKCMSCLKEFVYLNRDGLSCFFCGNGHLQAMGKSNKAAMEVPITNHRDRGSDKHLKKIAEELTLIRKEKELQNNLLMQDMGMIPRPDEESKEQHKSKPDIASQLSEMFKR